MHPEVQRRINRSIGKNRKEVNMFSNMTLEQMEIVGDAWRVAKVILPPDVACEFEDELDLKLPFMPLGA